MGEQRSFLISAMTTLIKLEPSKVIPLFVRFLRYGDNEVKTASYVYLKKMGDNYLAEVEANLKKDGAI